MSRSIPLLLLLSFVSTACLASDEPESTATDFSAVQKLERSYIACQIKYEATGVEEQFSECLSDVDLGYKELIVAKSSEANIKNNKQWFLFRDKVSAHYDSCMANNNRLNAHVASATEARLCEHSMLFNLAINLTTSYQ